MLKRSISIICIICMLSTILLSLPASAGDSQTVLAPGSFDVVSESDVDASTNMANSEGEYYKTNAMFRLTGTGGWPIGSEFTVAEWENRSYNRVFSQNSYTGVAEGESYIQYHVQPETVLQIPLVIQMDTMTNLGGADAAYGKFVIKVSEDGETWAALNEANIQHGTDTEMSKATKFNMRVYSYKIEAGINYFRIYFPGQSEIKEAATPWNSGQACISAVMMIPAAAFTMDAWIEAPHQVITPGSFDVVSDTDVDGSTNMAKLEGKYYKTNAYFRLTPTSGWPIGSEFTVAEWENRSYNRLFSQNSDTGVAEGDSYIQYHVQPETVLQIPLVIQKDTMTNLGGADAAYGKFVIKISEDGETWAALDEANIQHGTDTEMSKATKFNMRVYSYKIGVGINYFRIYFPGQSEINEAATPWNSGQAHVSAVMMIPAAAFTMDAWEEEGGDEEEETQKVLPIGTFDEPGAQDIDPSTSMAKWEGEFYKTNGHFRLTCFKEWSWPLGEDITVDAWNKTYSYGFSPNSHTGVKDDEAYIQYHVVPGSELQVPLIFQTETMANFGGAEEAYNNFVIMVSNDGKLWKEINPENMSHGNDVVLTYVTSFNMRIYSYNIASNVNYVRIYFPYNTLISKHAWNSGQASVSAVMMIPAAAFESTTPAAKEDFENIVITPTLVLSKLRLTVGDNLTANFKGATAATSWIGIYKGSEMIESAQCGVDEGSKLFSTSEWTSGDYTAVLYRSSGTGEELVTVEFALVDPVIPVEQQALKPGSYDSVSPDNYKLNDSTGTKNNGDCIIDNNTTAYMKSTGNVKGAPTNNWVFSPDNKVVMWGRVYDYVYTQYHVTELASKTVSISYKVEKGTQLQLPIGIPTEVKEFFDDFKFEVSADGTTWNLVDSENISYTEKVLDLAYDPTVRTYEIEIVEDGYFRLTWPNQTELEEATKHLNVGFLSQGGVFVVPAAAFVSSYAAAIDVLEEQYLVSLSGNVLSVLQSKDKPMTIAQLKKLFVLQNSYVKFFDSQGREITDEKTQVKSDMVIKAYASGSKYTADDEMFREITIEVTTVDEIVEPEIKSLDKTVVIDEEAKTITGHYYTDQVMSIKDLLELISVENGEYTLITEDGIEFTGTGSTVGNVKVYLQLAAKDCPNIEDGTVTATYEILGVSQTKELVFESLDNKKVKIDSNAKIVSVAKGMTVAEFLKNVRLEWCSIIVYQAPDEDVLGFVEVTDMNTVIVPGMSMDLVIPNTTIYYEFEVFEPTGENVDTGDSIIAIISLAMLALAACIAMRVYRHRQQVIN